jgi:hypothetical protein
MSFKDMFRSKEDVARELATRELEDLNWYKERHGNDPLYETLVEAATESHMREHEKGLMVGYLDAFYRKK